MNSSWQQPVFSTFAITAKESETEVPDTLEQREPVSQTRDSMKNTESGLESPAEKAVTKQDYQRMTDAFMKLWNQVEKERDIPQNRGDYQRVLRL